MGEENISSLASVEFEILVSIFSLPPPREGVAASVENEQIVITHEMKATRARVIGPSPPGVHGGGWCKFWGVPATATCIPSPQVDFVYTKTSGFSYIQR